MYGSVSGIKNRHINKKPCCKHLDSRSDPEKKLTFDLKFRCFLLPICVNLRLLPHKLQTQEPGDWRSTDDGEHYFTIRHCRDLDWWAEMILEFSPELIDSWCSELKTHSDPGCPPSVQRFCLQFAFSSPAGSSPALRDTEAGDLFTLYTSMVYTTLHGPKLYRVPAPAGLSHHKPISEGGGRRGWRCGAVSWYFLKVRQYRSTRFWCLHI